MHKPFERVLNNSFVDGNGRLRQNLQTSRSKVAKKVRTKREEEDRKERRTAFLKETKVLRQYVVSLRQRETNIYKAAQAEDDPDMRSSLFEEAAKLRKESQECQKQIDKLAEKYGQ